MSYEFADVRFNNGRGTVLCNVCSIMLTDACDTRHQIDCYHLCEDCYNRVNAMKVEIIEDENGELILPIPDDIMKQVDWKIGDTLVWEETPSNNFILRKKQDHES